MSQATLLVIQGVDQGTRFELGGEAVGVGRGVQNEIRLLDTEVSRRHALVEPLDGGFVIQDRNSSNGTFVNGKPIRHHQLHNGDQIQIGRSIILFSGAITKNDIGQVSEKIDLVNATGPDDRSQIVEESGHGPDSTLLGHANRTLSPETHEESAPALAEALANLQVLYRISEEVVSPSISQDQLLKRILDLTIDVSGADRGCILLADPESGEIIPQVFSHRRNADVSEKMPVSRSIVDYVLQNNQGVRTSDAQSDQRFEPGQSILQAGIREALCVPMQGRFHLMGVLYVDTTTSPERVVISGGATNKFTEEQLRLLVAIGRESAIAIENNRYQDALLKAERLAAVGQTIAMLSHHIKNILQGVRGGSYLIDMGLNDHNEDLVRKGWGIVEKNQNKIYHLVMDMLTFSKERQPLLEEVPLNDLITEVCELMQSRAEECGVQLEWNLDDNLPLTIADSEGIHRAVLNIVTNAIDAAEETEGGTVLVQNGYDSDLDKVFIAVTDNGPGIPEDRLKTIFNLFESNKGSRGTGLGLAVSQKIIREHGGEITLESKPGEGSRFTLAWPRFEDEHARNSTSPEE